VRRAASTTTSICFARRQRCGGRKTIGRPEITNDPRFKQNADGDNQLEELRRIIEDWTAKRSKQEVMKLMGDAGVPCGAVLDSMELLNDPHLNERGILVTVDHPVPGKFTMPGCPVKLEDSPVKVTSAPLLGQHNREIYRRMLELTDGDLEQLKQQGVI
jgi:formyl-CoA transferase